MWDSRGCLALQVQLDPRGTMALLENLDQRETLDHVVSHGLWYLSGAYSYCFYHKAMQVAGTEPVPGIGKDDALRKTLCHFRMDYYLFDLCPDIHVIHSHCQRSQCH